MNTCWLITRMNSFFRLLVLAVLLCLSSAGMAKPLEKVSVQLEWVFQFEFAGFIAAIEKGFYREAGLDVELIEYQPGIDTVKDVLSGKVEYGIHNSSLVIKNGKPADVVMLATYLQRSPLVFVTSKAINKPSDLIGKRIMGTTDEFRYSSLALLMSHFYINQENTRFIEHSFSIDDFVEGRVDAMTAFRSNQLFELDQLGIEYNIIDPSDYGFYMTADNLFTAHDQALKYPERAQRFIEASNQGWRYALDNTEEIVDIILEKYSQRKTREALLYEAEVTRSMMLTSFFQIGHINIDLAERTFLQLKNAKLLDDDVDYYPLSLERLMTLHGFDGKVLLTVPEKQYLLQKGSLKLCVDPDWMPFESISNNQHTGIVADIFEQMIQPHLPVPIQLYPTQSWEQSLQAAKQRDCDLVSLLSPTPERSEYLDFTDVYVKSPLVLATTKDQFFIDDISQVKEQPIGYIRGYSYFESLKKRIPDINLVPVASIQEGLNKVESGELYGYIDNLSVIAQQIRQEYSGELKISARLKEQDENAIGTRNDEPMLHEIFSRLVENINLHEDRLQPIYNKWISVKFESARDYTLAISLSVLFLIVLLAMAYHNWRIRKYSQKLQKLSVTDSLTQSYNRVKGHQILNQERDNFLRYHQPCGVIMVDIDWFKSINDTHGHKVGDQVLIGFVKLLKAHMRVTDMICRWGGEEFLLICPHQNLQETHQVAEKLLKHLREHDFVKGLKITASFGVGVFEKGFTNDELLEKVDMALYAAKEAGRNQTALMTVG